MNTAWSPTNSQSGEIVLSNISSADDGVAVTFTYEAYLTNDATNRVVNTSQMSTTYHECAFVDDTASDVTMDDGTT